MPSPEKIEHALTHPEEFLTIIPNLDIFRECVQNPLFTDRLFEYLLINTNAFRHIVSDLKNLVDTADIEADLYLKTAGRSILYQERIYKKFIEDSDLFYKLIKNESDLRFLAKAINNIITSKEKNSRLKIEIIKKTVASTEKFLDIFHPKDNPNSESRNLEDQLLGHMCLVYPEAKQILWDKEVDEVFPILFQQIGNNNVTAARILHDDVEDMVIRAETFTPRIYQYCMEQTKLTRDKFEDRSKRDQLEMELEYFDRNRPQSTASLLVTFQQRDQLLQKSPVETRVKKTGAATLFTDGSVPSSSVSH